MQCAYKAAAHGALNFTSAFCIFNVIVCCILEFYVGFWYVCIVIIVPVTAVWRADQVSRVSVHLY